VTTARPLIALLPSPLLGPAVWHRVADQLARSGWPVAQVPPPGGLHDSDDVLEWFLTAIPSRHDVVLVPHSNAGLYVPLLCERRDAVGAVFVDAGLPPRSGTVPVAPEQFADFLARKAEPDGTLPPWTQWWDEDISGLFPSAEVRDEVEREQQRLPLRYFATALDVTPGWDDMPCAYLAFGDTYAAERADAIARGWPTRVMDGQHLHTLIDPAGVASEITALLTH
jgi:hypothetical protein